MGVSEANIDPKKGNNKKKNFLLSMTKLLVQFIAKFS